MSSSIQTTSAMGDASLSSQSTSATSNLSVAAPREAIPTATTYGATVAGGTNSTDMSHASGNILSLTAPIVAGSVGYGRIDQQMADTKFADSLHRNVKIATFTNFTDPLGYDTWTPWNLWATDTFVADKLRNFNYIRGSLIISGVYKGPPLSSGLAIISFCPTYEVATPFNVALNIMSVLPHVMIDLAASSDFEFTLPWVVSSDWGNLSDDLYEGSWNMCLKMLAPLQTAIQAGCASGQLTIFARPGPDFQLSGATYQSGRVVSGRGNRSVGSHPTQSVAPLKGLNASHPSSTAQETVNDYSRSVTGYKPSELLGGISKVAGALSVVPVIGPAAAMVSAASSVASSWAEWFGFTRKTIIDPPFDVNLRTSNNLISCDASDTSAVGALFTTNALSIDPAINGGFSSIDETSLAHIGGKFTLIGDMTFTVGDNSYQDQLVPVTPCIGTFIASDTQYIPCSAGYVAGRFAQWRGDMKYLFYPVVSPIHRGSLQFIWQPVPHSADIGLDLTNISLNTIVDISVARPIEVTIGYNNDNPMCFTDFYALDTPMTSADYATLNGYLRVRCINPIVGSLCGQEIKVLVFAAAGDNMEFALPVDSVVVEGSVKFWGSDVDIFSMLQSGTVGADAPKMISVQLVPSSGPYPVADILSGERILSLRALMQKPSPDWTGPEPAYTDRRNFDHGPYKLHDPINYMNYFGSVFLAFAGSIRYKYLTFTGDNLGLEEAPFISNAVTAWGSLPLAQWNPTVVGGFAVSETTVPYYHNEKFVPAYKPTLLTDTMVFQYPSEFTSTEVVYKCAGPDMRLTTFRAQNKWVFVTDPVHFPEISVFSLATYNVGEGFAALSAPTTEKTVRQRREITPDQYRARTGRTAFKETDRTKRRDATLKYSPQSTQTEDQAIREDAVA